MLAAQPGGYTGTVVIDDPRVSGGSATYTVNLKYQDLDRVMAAVAFSGLIGAGVGLSAVAAAYAVYLAQYETDPSWEGSAALFTSLMATCVADAYAATTIAGTVEAEPVQQ